VKIMLDNCQKVCDTINIVEIETTGVSLD